MYHPLIVASPVLIGTMMAFLFLEVEPRFCSTTERRIRIVICTDDQEDPNARRARRKRTEHFSFATNDIPRFVELVMH